MIEMKNNKNLSWIFDLVLVCAACIVVILLS